MKKIGITTTVPIEVLMAARFQPLDLNNIFINNPSPDHLVNVAERAGFPLNCCTWIKGIYGICMEQGIDTVLCVTTGDCSNTLMLMEVFRLKGLNVISFAYPQRPNPAEMRQALEGLAKALGASLEEAERIKERLREARRLDHGLDELTWRGGKVTGLENHLWLVSTSDFNGDIEKYERELGQLLEECRKRSPYPEDMLRLAYIGVPPVFARDFYPYLERQGARVVFNEIQRQFAMPHPGNSLEEQYSNYTYPYSVFDRLGDILPELRRRRVEGVIHYVQAFCHRGIADIIFRHSINLPLLTLEGNADYLLTQHQRTRIEAFLDMVRRRQRRPQGKALSKVN